MWWSGTNVVVRLYDASGSGAAVTLNTVAPVVNAVPSNIIENAPDAHIKVTIPSCPALLCSVLGGELKPQDELGSDCIGLLPPCLNGNACCRLLLVSRPPKDLLP